jgi:hypothetical protein
MLPLQMTHTRERAWLRHIHAVARTRIEVRKTRGRNRPQGSRGWRGEEKRGEERRGDTNLLDKTTQQHICTYIIVVAAVKQYIIHVRIIDYVYHLLSVRGCAGGALGRHNHCSAGCAGTGDGTLYSAWKDGCIMGDLGLAGGL